MRARDHWRYALWASWAQDVRYRRCKTPQQARKLEVRLINKVDCICRIGYGKVTAFHVGRHGSYRGEEWSAHDQEMKVNHVTGACRLPGGCCDPDYIREFLAGELAGKAGPACASTEPCAWLRGSRA